MAINSKLFRSALLGEKFAKYFYKKNITEEDFAKKAGTTQPNINSVINGKKIFSDKYYKNLFKNVGLSDSEIEEIFKEADMEEFFYKYGENIPDEKLITYEEALSWIQKKQKLTPKQLKAVKEFIEFQKLQGKD